MIEVMRNSYPMDPSTAGAGLTAGRVYNVDRPLLVDTCDRARDPLPAPTSAPEFAQLRAEHNAAMRVQSEANHLARLALPTTATGAREMMRASALLVIAEARAFLEVVG